MSTFLFICGINKALHAIHYPSKNFALLESESEDYLLSPAYDLINTRIHVDDTDFALEDGLFSDEYESDAFKVCGQVGKDDFREFGTRIGIPEKRLERLLTPFFERQDRVYELIDNSYLDDPTKRAYRQYYETRRNHINR